MEAAVFQMTDERFSDQVVLLPADHRGGTVLARSCPPRKQCEFTTDGAGLPERKRLPGEGINKETDVRKLPIICSKV